MHDRVEMNFNQVWEKKKKKVSATHHSIFFSQSVSLSVFGILE